MTDDDTLNRMKKEYFNQDLYTDVIAFNIDDNPFEGEIYISYDRIKDNAKKFSIYIFYSYMRITRTKARQEWQRFLSGTLPN